MSRLEADPPASPIAHLLAKSHKEAKYGRSGQSQETLEEHTGQVVAMLAALMHRSPHLREISGREDFWHVAFWAAVVHDFGKAASGFQAMLRGGESFAHRHEVLSLAFVPWVSEARTRQAITLGVVSHHRDMHVIRDTYLSVSRGKVHEDTLEFLDAQLEAQDIAALRAWVQSVPEGWRTDLGFAALGAKALALSADEALRQAIESGVWAYFDAAQLPTTARPWATLLRGIIQQADRLASAEAVPPAPFFLPDADTLAARISERLDLPITLRPHQLEAARAGHLIFLAPTGSGKTEAALLWAHCQQRDLGAACRVTYGLPYQASLNAMQTRLQDDLRLEHVAILHGRALQVLFQATMQAHAGDSGDSAESVETALRESRRVNDHQRLHHPPVAVVTPYQLLRAAYRLPGYETVLGSVAGSALILDEIHAYEPQRLGMFLAVLEDLVTRWGVRACVITATMPGWLRRRLEDLLGVPALLAPEAVAFENCRHRIQVQNASIEDAAILDEIARRVQGGESMLVAVNTVAKAQVVMAALSQRLGGGRVLLLHSRLTGRDRKRREDQVLSLLKAGKQGQPIAVVATQVIEVSLDLDFDGIVSEPAPLEALIQRFGRVNRRGKKGEVADLAGHQIKVVPVTVLTQPRDGQGIYEPALIEGTLAVLREAEAAGGLLHDGLLSGWLDRIYDGQTLEELLGKLELGYSEVKRMLADLKPFESDIDLKEEFEKLFDGVEVLPKKFETEYRAVVKTSPIEARSLLVPINQRRRNMHRGRIRWDEELKLLVADFPYDDELGLQFHTSAQPPKSDDWGDL